MAKPAGWLFRVELGIEGEERVDTKWEGWGITSYSGGASIKFKSLSSTVELLGL